MSFKTLQILLKIFKLPTFTHTFFISFEILCLWKFWAQIQNPGENSVQMTYISILHQNILMSCDLHQKRSNCQNKRPWTQTTHCVTPLGHLVTTIQSTLDVLWTDAIFQFFIVTVVTEVSKLINLWVTPIHLIYTHICTVNTFTHLSSTYQLRHQVSLLTGIEPIQCIVRTTCYISQLSKALSRTETILLRTSGIANNQVTLINTLTQLLWCFIHQSFWILKYE